MQNLRQKFIALNLNEKFLLVFACLLLLFVFTKLFVIENQQNKLENLKNRAALIQQQKILLDHSNSASSTIQEKQTNELVSDFLRRHNSNDKLKNIRATNSGEQRYELESIPFNTFLELLVELDRNGSQHSMLQLKENKVAGTVNAVLVSR